MRKYGDARLSIFLVTLGQCRTRMFPGYTAARTNKGCQWRRMRRRQDPGKTASGECLLGYYGMERTSKTQHGEGEASLVMNFAERPKAILCSNHRPKGRPGEAEKSQ